MTDDQELRALVEVVEDLEDLIGRVDELKTELAEERARHKAVEARLDEAEAWLDEIEESGSETEGMGPR